MRGVMRKPARKAPMIPTTTFKIIPCCPLVRMTMLEASRRQGVPPDRISFVDALRWLATAQPGDELPMLVVNPSRPGRQEPRVRKRRPKSYPLMRQPRAILKQKLATAAEVY